MRHYAPKRGTRSQALRLSRGYSGQAMTVAEVMLLMRSECSASADCSSETSLCNSLFCALAIRDPRSLILSSKRRDGGMLNRFKMPETHTLFDTLHTVFLRVSPS